MDVTVMENVKMYQCAKQMLDSNFLPQLYLNSIHSCRLTAKPESPCLCPVTLRLAESWQTVLGFWYPQLLAATHGEGRIPSFLVLLPVDT